MPQSTSLSPAPCKPTMKGRVVRLSDENERVLLYSDYNLIRNRVLEELAVAADNGNMQDWTSSDISTWLRSKQQP